ncbi:hypothetical protein SAMN04488109_0095 [Chryseolinea serpens]|uniref:DUF6985 domain-containing protein n=1 Tax=Chryseolinea serpens TaxID=947013 RepID=A0A1M5JJ82_9BACT|nr:hypothetical protein [Chryseolinea serpens]SHG40591.1 hypothetical protein SAMN04488109_0095 [Chryseolinea serpens]
MEIESKIVGRLKPSEFDADFYTSEPFEIPYFDNIKMKIGFVEAKHGPYLEQADKTLRAFLSLNAVNRIQDSERVYKYYHETLKHGYTKPLTVKTSSEIWNHVSPGEIIIDWNEHGEFYLCVSCGCDWEEEHGLQLVFKDGETLTRASGHDGHYTD